MHSRSDGISVRNVSKTTIVHESDPEFGAPGRLIRISFDGVAGVGWAVAVFADATTDIVANIRTRTMLIRRTRVREKVMKSWPPPACVPEFQRMLLSPAVWPAWKRNWRSRR